jgi:hypothetical protein
MLLFILGPHKTFTSSLVGLLNADPEILLLFETEPYETRPTGWALQLVQNRPDLGASLGKDDDIERAYQGLHSAIVGDRSGYAIFGDKIATIDDAYLERLAPFKKIVTLRDVRTWLAKQSIRRMYALDADIVRSACQYVRFLIKTRTTSNVLVIRLEDVVANLPCQVKRASAFLGRRLDIPKRWWESVGSYDSRDPKQLQPWWERHPSSSTDADSLDVRCQISSHPFWDALLPIFERHFDPEAAISPDSADSDLLALQALQTRYRLAWVDAFVDVTEVSREPL